MNKKLERFITAGIVAIGIVAIMAMVMMNSYINDLEDMVIELKHEVMESNERVDEYKEMLETNSDNDMYRTEEGYISKEYLEELEYNSMNNEYIEEE